MVKATCTPKDQASGTPIPVTAICGCGKLGDDGKGTSAINPDVGQIVSCVNDTSVAVLNVASEAEPDTRLKPEAIAK
jgi:hypothetical protein